MLAGCRVSQLLRSVDREDPTLSHERGNLPGPRGVGPAAVCMLTCVRALLLTRSFYDSATPPEHGGPRTQGLGTSELLEQQKWLGDAYVLKDLLGPSRTTWRSDSYFGEAVTRPTAAPSPSHGAKEKRASRQA